MTFLTPSERSVRAHSETPRWDTDDRVFMWAFDLIELNGIDLRSDPLGKRPMSPREFAVPAAA